jgi:hypothetical protein
MPLVVPPPAAVVVVAGGAVVVVVEAPPGRVVVVVVGLVGGLGLAFPSVVVVEPEVSPEWCPRRPVVVVVSDDPPELDVPWGTQDAAITATIAIESIANCLRTTPLPMACTSSLQAADAAPLSQPSRPTSG